MESWNGCIVNFNTSWHLLWFVFATKNHSWVKLIETKFLPDAIDEFSPKKTSNNHKVLLDYFRLLKNNTVFDTVLLPGTLRLIKSQMNSWGSWTNLFANKILLFADRKYLTVVFLQKCVRLFSAVYRVF